MLGAGEEGVTWRVWKELPPPPVEEGQEDAPPPPPAFPDFIHIDNVIREPGVSHHRNRTPLQALVQSRRLSDQTGIGDLSTS
jgi:hypothetical protein